MKKKKQQLNLEGNKEALVIVAHPDDEIIWMGGTIMRFQEVRWTCFSLCRQDDVDREPKFQRVMKEISAKGIISDVEDDDIMQTEESVEVFKKKILNIISNKRFDYIFCHGENGEYGHMRHIGLHVAVKELFLEKKLSTTELYFFSYLRIERKILPMIPSEKCNFLLDLKPNE